MKEILFSPHRNKFLWGLSILLVCAWFSNGTHHYDEHYQILEFANLKMGGTSADQMPWEFHEQIRPAIQPAIAFAFMKVCSFITLTNPFTITLLLRIFIGIVSWFVTCKMLSLLIRDLSNQRSIRLFIFMSFFLWWIPYINVRFSSENLSAILLLAGIFFFLKSSILSVKSIVIAGLLFGFAFFVRFQICFAVAGFVLWLILIRKISLKQFLLLSMSIAVGTAICILIDRWYYGHWLLTPLNYFHANLVLGKAAGWGVFPWWYYFTQFFVKAIPPISIFLLLAFFVGVYKNLRNALVWTIIPFLLGHMLVGHKEMRFLFPVCFIFIYIASLGIQDLLERKWYLKMHKAIVVISIIIILPVGIYRTIAPADVAIPYLEFLYHYQPEQTTEVLSIQDDVYKLSGLEANYYRPMHITPYAFSDTISIRDFVSQKQPDHFLFLNTRFPFTLNVDGYKSEMIYCAYPDWVLKVNINHWQERTYIWSFYKFSKV